MCSSPRPLSGGIEPFLHPVHGFPDGAGVLQTSGLLGVIGVGWLVASVVLFATGS